MSLPAHIKRYPFTLKRNAPFEKVWKPAYESLQALRLRRQKPTLTIFHNPHHKDSTLVLGALQEVQKPSSPELEATLSKQEKDRKAKAARTQILRFARQKDEPLEAYDFKLEVLERTPSAEEFNRLIRRNIPEPSFLYFLQNPNIKHLQHPTNGWTLHSLLHESPELMKWPIVVNWASGDMMIGKDRPAFSALLRPMRLLGKQWPVQLTNISTTTTKPHGPAYWTPDWNKLS